MAPARSKPRNRPVSPRPYRRTRSMRKAEMTSEALLGLQTVSLEEKDVPMLETAIATQKQEQQVPTEVKPKKAKKTNQTQKSRKVIDVNVRPHGIDTTLPKGETPGSGSYGGSHDVRPANLRSQAMVDLHEELTAAQLRKSNASTVAAEDRKGNKSGPPTAPEKGQRARNPRKGKAAKTVQDKDGDADMEGTVLSQDIDGASSKALKKRESKTKSPSKTKVRDCEVDMTERTYEARQHSCLPMHSPIFRKRVQVRAG